MVETILVYVLGTILIVCAVGILWCVLGLIKNEVTFKNRNIILDGICDYRIYCISHNIEPKVNYSDMEEYDDTFKRFWDFGYTRILSEDKFNIIKYFIEKRR